MFNKSIFLLLFSLSSLQAITIINETSEPLELYVNRLFSLRDQAFTIHLEPGRSCKNPDFKSFIATARGSLRREFAALSRSDEIRITSFAGFLLK